MYTRFVVYLFNVFLICNLLVLMKLNIEKVN